MSYLTLQLAEPTCAQFYADGPRNHNGDSGFDLYVPKAVTVPAGARGFRLDHGVCAALRDVYGTPKPYMLCPRSSMGAKTPLRLSNSVGIIDRTYRGNIIALLDNTSQEDYEVQVGDRLVQIVQFSGEPVTDIAIGTLDQTLRGSGGFGSTGR